jgi:3-oxoacyl-[acyl-carrier protein] reductase
MSDFLLDLATNPTSRALLQRSGLPIPTPEPLRRARSAWEERPLAGCRVVVGAPAVGALTAVLADTLAHAGARTTLASGAASSTDAEDTARIFGVPAEAYGLPLEVIAPSSSAEDRSATRARALLFDATTLRSLDDLDALYAFFHTWLPSLERSGRVIVLARPEEADGEPNERALAMALEGFTRSLAKEIGRRGATANLLRVAAGAESRVEPVLRFLLSPRSAFVTAQPLTITAEATAARDVPLTRVLAGKVALVTGAARGIGEATARLLAAEGAHVVCLDRPDDDAPLGEVARRVGGSVLLADMASSSAPALIRKQLRAQFGGVDIVVHNAGITRDKTLARMSESLWQQTLDVNLRGVARVTDALLDGTLRHEGRIVCLSSVAGIAGNVGQTNYAASKAGILGLVRGHAPRVAARGITINAIAPGFIETRLTRAIPVVIREAGRRLSALGQGGLPEDVGQAILFLASPGAHGITGQALRVCGGALIGA